MIVSGCVGGLLLLVAMVLVVILKTRKRVAVDATVQADASPEDKGHSETLEISGNETRGPNIFKVASSEKSV